MENQNIFIDTKDASYYRNNFLNNCKMRINLCNRIINRIQSIENLITQIREQDNKKDQIIQSDDQEINIIQSKLDDLNTCVNQYYNNTLQNEFKELLSKDYESFLKQNEDLIKKQ